MRARWLTAAFLLVVAVVLVLIRWPARRPAERVSPAPQVNSAAVVWRTPAPPRSPQAGDVWVNPKDGMEMVYVPAGEFTMGSTDADIAATLKEDPKAEAGDFADERPQFRVRLPAYWMDKCEVTVAQYREFCHKTGREMPEAPVAGWQDDHPVVNVTWDDAAAYAKWAGKRLPTEMEWEKAARGTDGRTYPWGSQWPPPAGTPPLRGYDDGYVHTAPVGKFPGGASPYGAWDMVGNVYEWCADWYDEEAYYRYARGDVTPAASRTWKVLRGHPRISGYPTALRCAYRSSSHPGDRYGDGIGFRCARGADRVSSAPQVNSTAVVRRTAAPPTDARVGDVWVSPKDGAEMVYVPAGEFTMGSSDADIAALLKENPDRKAGDFADESPQFRVRLPAYWIDKCEVTVAQYREFCHKTGREIPEAPVGGWQDDHPVVNVTWEDAAAYAKWAGKRLPTEMEWEKAARGTDGRTYPWGGRWPPPAGSGNFADETFAWEAPGLVQTLAHYSDTPPLRGYDDGYVRTAPVGEFPGGASPYGALDMAGNVWEWCMDWYHEGAYEPYAKGHLTAPTSEGYKVLRGGAWWDADPALLRCACRRFDSPGWRDDTFGFRCARGLP